MQRVVNGGGRLEREYALGTGRADILVRYFHSEDGKRVEQRFVVELKVRREKMFTGDNDQGGADTNSGIC